MRGELTWRDSLANRRKPEKRKELLAKRLKTFFGIKDEPFDNAAERARLACSLHDHPGSIDHGEISPGIPEKNFRIRHSPEKLTIVAS